MILAIEIGGTKLQWAVVAPDNPQTLCETGRAVVDRVAGAEGIRRQLSVEIARLQQRHAITCVGVGFGGPVISDEGWVITSHQVAGWDEFPLGSWLEQLTGCPACVDNDCNVAALAEARLGAGLGRRRVLYVTIGTGVGGGFIVDGRIDGQSMQAIAEIGHLRPGLASRDAAETVESWSSGLGMERRAAAAIADPARWHASAEQAAELQARQQQLGRPLTAADLIQAAFEGQYLAGQVLQRSTEVLGWALAQATTLMAPERIVIGGGVSLSGEPLRQRLQESWETYVFPPLRGSCELVLGTLGEAVVLHGAALLASASRCSETACPESPPTGDD